MDKTISIGARYLREGIKRDYSEWKFAWAREVGQNSVDAGATTVIATVTYDGDNDQTIVKWNDDGCGMSEEIIETKFMALGETGKDSAVGGMGVAGALIAFAQSRYTIESGYALVEGAGSAYSISRGSSYVNGVNLTVYMEGHEFSEIAAAIRKWVTFSVAKTKFFLNGEELKTFRPRKTKTETEWCKVTTAHDIGHYSPEMHIRIGGQLMHSRYTSFDNHIIVDIVGKSSLEMLTANRDGLQWKWADKLNRLIAELYEDPNKIKETIDHTTIWHGKEGMVSLEADRKVSKISLATAPISRPVNKEAALAIISTLSQIKPVYEAKTLKEIEAMIDGHDIVIVNQTNKEVPAKWIPGSMNKHAYALINRWLQVVQFAGRLMDRTENVSIGFVFSQSAAALYKYTREHGHMILINPIEAKEKSFVNSWDNSTASFYKLVASAVHELCHIDNGGHNTSFAADITYGMAKVMSRSTALKKIKSQTKV